MWSINASRVMPIDATWLEAELYCRDSVHSAPLRLQCENVCHWARNGIMSVRRGQSSPGNVSALENSIDGLLLHQASQWGARL